MADPLPGQTRESLALLFFNSIAAQERSNGQLDRAYALDLLADVIASIDGKRVVTEQPAAMPGVAEAVAAGPKRKGGRPKKTAAVAAPVRRGRRSA